MTNLMTVREVAAYLKIKERKVYDLAQRGELPCSRVGRKWVFPRDLIDAWVARGVAAHRRYGSGDLREPAIPEGSRQAPPIVAGSHDPLLEWSLRQSHCGLGSMPGGSLDGIRRLVSGEVQVCALHILDGESGEYNVPALREMAPDLDLVAIEWAVRRQGLLAAAGNPLGLRSLADLREKQPRFVPREADAGTTMLLNHLLRVAGLDAADVAIVSQVARSQTDVGLAILEGDADTGLAVEAVARQLHLEFIPLHEERFDLALRRRDYFEAPFQRLLDFARQPEFAARAQAQGYDVAALGRVRFNAP